MTKIANFPWSKHMLAVATAIGAWGTGIKPPVWLRQLMQHAWVQILLLTVLVYQGGGGQNLMYSALIAVAVYGLMYMIGDEYTFDSEMARNVRKGTKKRFEAALEEARKASN